MTNLFEIEMKGWWWKRWFRKYRFQKFILEKHLEKYEEEIDVEKMSEEFMLYGKTSLIRK